MFLCNGRFFLLFLKHSITVMTLHIHAGAPPPDEQCTYYGSFVYPMSKISNLDKSVPSYSGSLVRDVSNEYMYAISDIIPEDI